MYIGNRSGIESVVKLTTGFDTISHGLAGAQLQHVASGLGIGEALRIGAR